MNIDNNLEKYMVTKLGFSSYLFQAFAESLRVFNIVPRNT
jgi:hypothetical protein